MIKLFVLIMEYSGFKPTMSVWYYTKRYFNRFPKA